MARGRKRKEESMTTEDPFETEAFASEDGEDSLEFDGEDEDDDDETEELDFGRPGRKLAFQDDDEDGDDDDW